MEEILLDTNNLTEEQMTKLRSLYHARKRLHEAGMKADYPAIDRNRKSLARLHEECDQLEIPYEIQNRVYRAAVNGRSFDDINFKSSY